MSLLDAHYTPPEAADLLIRSVAALPITSCLDSSCGEGSLLEAVLRQHPSANCFGIDVDRKALKVAQHSHPNWTLSCADFASAQSRLRANAFKASKGCDLLVSNPPYSMGNVKRYSIKLNDSVIFCSLSMMHILIGLYEIKPKYGIVALVPESLLHSSLDKNARDKICQSHDINVTHQFSRNTFAGVYPNSLAITITPKITHEQPVSTRSFMYDTEKTICHLVRGGLQVHSAVSDVEGVHFLHSTNLRSIHSDQATLLDLNRVKHTKHGKLTGSCLLFPRVGVPLHESVVEITIDNVIQLSDCVMAICGEKESVSTARRMVYNNWESFIDIYKGTGARYTTIDKVSAWFASFGIQLIVSSNYIETLSIDGEELQRAA